MFTKSILFILTALVAISCNTIKRIGGTDNSGAKQSQQDSQSENEIKAFSEIIKDDFEKMRACLPYTGMKMISIMKYPIRFWIAKCLRFPAFPGRPTVSPMAG